MTEPPVMPLARYGATFVAVAPWTMPAMPGAFWHGVLGNALVRLGRRTADGTPVYAFLFEGAAGAGLDRRFAHPPGPLVLAAEGAGGRTVAAGGPVELAFTLVGTANARCHDVIDALRLAGELGLGRERAKAQVRDVAFSADLAGSVRRPLAEAVCASPPVPPCPAIATVELRTPLRLRKDGRVVGPEALDARTLLMSCARRIALLQRLYADAAGTVDLAALAHLAERIVVLGRDLAWCEQRRWSARRRTEVAMGGVVGRLTLAMGEAAPLWPYLWLGQWTHIGNGAAMGLGALRVRAGGEEAD